MLALAALGCGPKGCETNGLEQLARSTPRNVYFPGRRLAAVAGDEVPVELLGKKGRPTALVTRDKTNRLHSYPFDGTKSCVTAAIAPPDDSTAGAVGDPIENVLPYTSKLNETQTSLTFMNERCEPIVAPFTNANLIGNPQGYDPERFVLRTDDGKLLELHPETRSTTTVAEQVSAAVLASEHLFTLEQETVTLRNQKLEFIGSFGANVTEMRVDSSNARVAFVDTQGLSYLDASTMKSKRVDSAACHVSWADAPSEAFALVYEQSCEDSTLIINLPEAGLRTVLPAGARKPVALRNLGTEKAPSWYASYFSNVSVVQEATATSSTASMGTRHLGPLGKMATTMGLARTANSLGAVESGRLLLWLSPDTTASKVLEWSPSAQSDYQLNVEGFALSPTRVLVTDDRGSRLVQIAATEKPATLLEDASSTGNKASGGLFLSSNVKNGVGRIHFLPKGEATPEALFDDAQSTSAQLSWESSAAVALEHYSTANRLGTLSVRILETADTFSQPDVRSFAPTARPAQGIAYVAKAADGYDLYWAAAE